MPVKVGLRYIEIWKDSMEDAVRAYEQEPIEKGQIVFYGPSNFTRWSPKYGNPSLRETLLGKSGQPCAINRGFGSSCSEHQLYYYPRMVRPLEPKVLVYSPFGNFDSFGYSVEECWELAQRVIIYALTDFPGIRIYLCSSFACRDMNEKGLEMRARLDGLMKEFAKNTPDVCYVDVMSREEMKDKSIFIEDGVHYNPEGYRRYAEMFREVLKDELDKY